jgi:hypothetical protein
LFPCFELARPTWWLFFLMRILANSAYSPYKSTQRQFK